MLSDSEIDDFVIEQKPKNTVKKTKSDVGIFKRWLAQAVPTETRELEEISAVQLNSYLWSFYLTVKKRDGENYEPDSLLGIKNSIDRYLSEKNYPVSVCRGEEFKSSRNVLSAKGKQLKKEGKGRKPNRADQVSEEEEEVFKNVLILIFFLLLYHSTRFTDIVTILTVSAKKSLCEREKCDSEAE